MGKTIRETMQEFTVNQALKYLEGNPEENIPKLMSFVDRLMPKDWYTGQRNAIRKAIAEKNNWYQLILRLYELDPGVRRAFFQNFITNASLKGSATQEELSKKYNCNIPRDIAARHRKNFRKNTTAISRGRSFWIPPQRAT